MFLCVSVCILLAFITKIYANISPSYYCADMNPQRHVNIEQLMGMWYGVELLTHSAEEMHYVQVMPSCPILHISEDKNYYVTRNPLHKNYDYRYNYGERRDFNQRQYDRNQHQKYLQQHYSTQSPYNTDNYNTRRYGTLDQNNRRLHNADEWKRLRIWWDENGSSTEYHLRYNITRPGFWLSSGPQNGSELEPQYSHFAGTVQVIKAVGSHMALTFCHQLPDRQLFTILLSRENKLDFADIHSVHSLLNNRGLSTTSVKKVCANGAEKIKLKVLGWMVVVVLSTLLL